LNNGLKTGDGWGEKQITEFQMAVVQFAILM
jgi:hypothetical protein